MKKKRVNNLVGIFLVWLMIGSMFVTLLTITSTATQNTGWKSPSAHGISDNEWSNQENAYSSNDQYATAEGQFLNQDYYNFNLNVPTSATINGIEVTIEGHGETFGSDQIIVEVWSASNGKWGVKNNGSGGWWVLGDGVDETVIGGSSTDLWDATWHPSDFSNSNFLLRVKTWSNRDKLYVDHVQVKVHYTEDEDGHTDYPKPTISVSDNKDEITVDETDWVKFTVTNTGTEYTSSWGLQIKVGDGLDLVQHSNYLWDQKMCNNKAVEWYKTTQLNSGDSAYIEVGIKGKNPSNYESVWYTAWMHDPDGQPEATQYTHDYHGDPCNRQYAEYGVKVTTSTVDYPKPVLTSPLEITPAKDEYYVGDTLTAEFTITNKGTQSVTLDILTVGGRLNGGCPDDTCPDFTFRSTILQPDVPYQYTGTLTLSQPGEYSFFIAYYIENPTSEEKELLDENNWNTCVDLGEGLTDDDRTEDIEVLSLLEAPYIENISPPSGTPGIEVRIRGRNFDKISYYHYVYFGSIEAKIKEINGELQWYDNEIVVYVPSGENKVEVTVGGFSSNDYNLPISHKSNSIEFTYNKPFIDYIDPFYGTAGILLKEHGTKVKIVGKDFGIDEFSRSKSHLFFVKFGESTASEISWSNNEIYVTAPFDYGLGLPELTFEVATGIIVGYCLGIKAIGIISDIKDVIEVYDRISKLQEMGAIDIILGDKEIQWSVNVKVYTPIGESNVKVFTYGLPNNLEYAHLCSPSELRVYDSQGNITGLVNGVVKEQIPNSLYDNESKSVIIFYSNDSYSYEVVGTSEGTYGLAVLNIDNGSVTDFTATDIPTSVAVTHQYIISWDNLSKGEKGVVLYIDSDKDGSFEKNITATTIIAAPIANIEAPYESKPDSLIAFNASASYDSDGNITSYEWDLGDGNIGSGKVITHKYSTSGEYIVTLTVKDNDGLTSTYSMKINIKKEGVPGFELLFFVAAIVIALLMKRKRS